MNTKFSEFNTINNGEINKTYVKAYVADKILDEKDTNDKKGKLVIVDNSDQDNPISSMISEYGFFIDDVFIAGGHGFKTIDDARKVLDTINSLDTFKNDLTSIIDDLNNKQLVINVIENINNYQDNDGIIGYQKYLDAEKNEYGFITSYKYLYSEKTEVIEENSVSKLTEYKIYIKDKSDINYINDIIIETDNSNEKDYVEIINNDAQFIIPFKVKFTINNNIVNGSEEHIVKYNNDLKVYLYSSTTLNANTQKIDPIQINDNSNLSLNYSNTVLFTKPTDRYSDDLILYIEDGNNEIVYYKKFENFLKWKDKYSFMCDSTYNDYNFRDTSFSDISSTIMQNMYNIFNDKFNNLSLEIEYDQEINIEFSHEENKESYDYLILRNNYENVEFYFNGIKSNNWKKQEIKIQDNQKYYIWQSPQKYIGAHTWKIIIKS